MEELRRQLENSQGASREELQTPGEEMGQLKEQVRDLRIRKSKDCSYS